MCFLGKQMSMNVRLIRWHQYVSRQETVASVIIHWDHFFVAANQATLVTALWMVLDVQVSALHYIFLLICVRTVILELQCLFTPNEFIEINSLLCTR